MPGSRSLFPIDPSFLINTTRQEVPLEGGASCRSVLASGRWNVYTGTNRSKGASLMKIQKIIANRRAALALAWEVFLEFEAPEYPPEGVASFRGYLNNPQAMAALDFMALIKTDTRRHAGGKREKPHQPLFCPAGISTAGIGERFSRLISHSLPRRTLRSIPPPMRSRSMNGSAFPPPRLNSSPMAPLHPHGLSKGKGGALRLLLFFFCTSFRCGQPALRRTFFVAIL